MKKNMMGYHYRSDYFCIFAYDHDKLPRVSC